MEQTALVSQECFSWLSIPNRQHDCFMQEALDQFHHETLFRSDSTGSLKSEVAPVTDGLASYKTINYISDEARALLLAYETAASRRADAWVAGNDACHESLPSTTNPFEPERILASTVPPKRFFRTFWISITIRMIRREKEKIQMLRDDDEDD